MQLFCKLEEAATPTSASMTADLNNPAQYLITARYIEGIKDMAKSENARIIFMPVESSRMLDDARAIGETLSRLRERT